LTEELVEEIGDGFADSDLPARYQLSIRLTDVVVNDPNGLTSDLAAALRDEFTPPELMELLLTTTLASAFSKAAIAWGPPRDMPILEVPTPAPGRQVGTAPVGGEP
jgi:alkylhydroperoxidase family enzyme